MASSGTWSGPFGYGGAFGYQSEPDSGLQLLGHRYYDPSSGRFLSRDKARDGRNWYGYCGNAPLVQVDPSGLQSLDSLRAYVLNLWKTYKDPKLIIQELDDLLSVGVSNGRRKVAEKARQFYQNFQRDLPQVEKLIKHVRAKGSPPKGLKGGRKFYNLDRKLPKKGDYIEYDLYGKGVAGRGPERVVIDRSSGRTWYSNNHYKDFFEVEIAP